jgi:DNA polymerase-3 subunit epsilon
VIVEIEAVELINRSPTGNTFHRYLCPERSMPADAVAVHGLSAEFLGDKPLFAAVVDEFLAFVGDAPLVAHNAGFDIAFLNAELKRIGKPPIAGPRDVHFALQKKAYDLIMPDFMRIGGVTGFLRSAGRSPAWQAFPYRRISIRRSTRMSCACRRGKLTGMAGLELPGFAAALRNPRRA